MKCELNMLNKKFELIQSLSTRKDSNIIEKIIDFRKSESKDWWNSISNNEKEGIENGIKDADSSKLNPHSSARKIYEKWL